MIATRFSSPVATVLTMLGVAVGLGNVWRFPYMMGSYGGSAFLLIYLVFLALVATPAIMAEWGLGRARRAGPVVAYRTSFGPRRGSLIAAILLIGVFMADSYYVVVIGQILLAALQVGGMPPDSAAWPRVAATMLVIVGSWWVLRRGLRRGIEHVSRAFVPFFLIAMVILAVRAWTLPGATAHMAQFLSPDFSAIGPAEVFAAMGQACFSLGLGGTFYVVYGSYLRAEQRLGPTALWTAGGDLSAALLASSFVIPAVLALGMDLASGPSLLFDTLPRLFDEMAYGSLFGSLFLVALAAVAFLSNLAALEVVQNELKEHIPQIGTRSVGVACLALGLVALPTALDPSLIGPLDLIFGSGMMMLGSLFAVVAFGWTLSREAQSAQLGAAARLVPWLKIGVPLAVSAILVGYILSQAH